MNNGLNQTSMRFNIVASPLIPQECHLFLRDEKKDDTPESTQNMHKYHMLWLCLSGRGGLNIDGVPYELAAGEAILLAPGQPHRRKNIANEKVQWLVIRFALESEPEWMTLIRNQPFYFDDKANRLLENFRAACAGYRNAPQVKTAPAECILLLALLLNHLPEIGKENDMPMRGSSPVVKRLCHLLVSAPGKGKTFAEIAREQGISAGHLRMLFKKATGKTPTAARADERRRRAESLLTHSNLNISEIATRLGFESIYAFSRFFKKVNGLSPLKFRRKIR